LTHRCVELVEPSTLLVDLLLDQRIAAGIGNVYKCEVLFLEGCAARQTLAETEPGRLGALYRRAAALLQENLGGGPRATRPNHDGRGHLWVYGRAGRPCLRCGTAIARDRIGAAPRTTYWCPTCQPRQRVRTGALPLHRRPGVG
jgi:endonuclease-8